MHSAQKIKKEAVVEHEAAKLKLDNGDGRVAQKILLNEGRGSRGAWKDVAKKETPPRPHKKGKKLV
jgi:hypothetical protein